MADSVGDVVLVTGASGGIGAKLAAEFAAGGHDLFLVARSAENLARTAAAIRSLHDVNVDLLALDLTDPGACDVLEAEVHRLGVHVEILVNNAGFGLAGRAARLDRHDQLEMIDLNIRANVDLILRFLPAMLLRKSGGILNVGSIAGFQPGPYMAGYYASKAFVGSFTAALATECQSAGVQITNLAPGPVRTGFADRAGMKRSGLFRKFKGHEAEAVAKAGYRGFKAGRRLIIPGFGNRAAIIAGRLVPARLRDAAIARVIGRR